MFDLHTVTRMELIAHGEWDALCGGEDFYLSRDWLRSVEGQIAARVRYLLARDRGGGLVGGLPIYDVLLEGNPNYSVDRYRAAFGFSGRVLVAGGYRGYRADIPLATGLAEMDRISVAAILVAEASRVARSAGLDGVLFPYLRHRGLEVLQRVARPVVLLDSAEAEIRVTDSTFDGYLRGLPGRRREHTRREIRKFHRAGWTLARERFPDFIDEAAILMNNVLRKHGYVEELGRLRRLLRVQASSLDERSVFITCRGTDGALSGFSLEYVWRDHLYGRLLGLDYDRLRSAFEYFNLVFYEPLRVMEGMALTCLHFGPGTLAAKVERGAVVRPLWAAFLPISGSASTAPLGALPGTEALTAQLAGFPHALHAEWDRAEGPGISVVSRSSARSASEHKLE